MARLLTGSEIVASHRTGRPMLLTEHGLYARERDMELSRAAWIADPEDPVVGLAGPSPLRRLWSRFFLMLSRVAYHQATRIITLSEVNRRKQIEDGADPAKLMVVPNGVALDSYRELAERRERATPELRPARVGFVGRVVPIKDVITLLRATAIAAQAVDLELWIVGPEDEDPAYAARCRELAARCPADRVKFLGRRCARFIRPRRPVADQPERGPAAGDHRGSRRRRAGGNSDVGHAATARGRLAADRARPERHRHPGRQSETPPRPRRLAAAAPRRQMAAPAAPGHDPLPDGSGHRSPPVSTTPRCVLWRTAGAWNDCSSAPRWARPRAISPWR
jgi:glycosyltransferase involved in cell wall biosynthesis